MTWRADAATVALVDDVMWALGVESLTKTAPRSPLTRSGFDALVADLTRALTSATSGARTQAVQAALVRLDQAWSQISPGERERVVSQALAGYAGALVQTVAATADVFDSHARTVIGRTRRSAVQRHQLALPLDDPFDAIDRRVIDHARTSNALFVRRANGRISARLSEIARRVVADGLESGLDDREIGRRMRQQIPAGETLQQRRYLETVATVFVGRARTYGLLRSFQDAGITTYEVRAVLDEVTSDTCRMMHGKRFSVGSAVGRYEDVAGSAPEDVIDLQPFIRQGRLPDGTRGLFVESRGARTPLAVVERSGVGRIDDVGAVRMLVGAGTMERLGCCSPPFHPRCRTTLVPVFGRARGQVPRGGPPARTVAPAATPAAPVVAPPAPAQVRRPVRPRVAPPRSPSPPPTSAPVPSVATPASTGAFDVSSVGGRPLVGPAPRFMTPEEAERQWRRPNVRVSADQLRAVFGERVPELERLLAAWSDPDSGIRAFILSASMVSGKLSFEFELRDPVTNIVYSEGPGERLIWRDSDGLNVYNAILRAYDDAPKGMGAHITRNSLALYSHLGVDYVKVSTAWAGKYVWAAFGFYWDAATARMMRAKFEDFLIANGVPADEAADEAERRHKDPWKIAEYDYGGKLVKATFHRIPRDKLPFDEEGEARMGQAFLLGNNWSGKIDLTNEASPSWQRAYSRVFKAPRK